jgi:hypothetical protein
VSKVSLSLPKVLLSGVSLAAIALNPASALEKNKHSVLLANERTEISSKLPNPVNPVDLVDLANTDNLIIQLKKQSQVVKALQGELKKLEASSETNLKRAAEIKKQIAAQKAKIKSLEKEIVSLKEKNTAACNALGKSVEGIESTITLLEEKQVQASLFSLSTPEFISSLVAGGLLGLGGGAVFINSKKPKSDTQSKPEKPNYYLPVASFVAGVVALPLGVNAYKISIVAPEIKTTYEQLLKITNPALTAGREQLEICNK